jgi:hypothetical protein
MAVIPLNSLAQRCPVCSGISVQFAVDWPISLLWTDCPVCRGLRVQFGLENAVTVRKHRTILYPVLEYPISGYFSLRMNHVNGGSF